MASSWFRQITKFPEFFFSARDDEPALSWRYGGLVAGWETWRVSPSQRNVIYWDRPWAGCKAQWWATLWGRRYRTTWWTGSRYPSSSRSRDQIRRRCTSKWVGCRGCRSYDRRPRREGWETSGRRLGHLEGSTGLVGIFFSWVYLSCYDIGYISTDSYQFDKMSTNSEI